MKIPSKYNHLKIEKKWNSYWTENNFFSSKPDKREPYTIVIPPPNITGVLHMGHMLNNTIQDILARKARMDGKEVLWLPGTDHAGIATQMVVERQLAAQNISRRDLGREVVAALFSLLHLVIVGYVLRPLWGWGRRPKGQRHPRSSQGCRTKPCTGYAPHAESERLAADGA